MKKFETIDGINRILKNNNIPWKFEEHEEYPEKSINGTIPGLVGDGSDGKIITRGGAGINLFPADVTGNLHDDFLGICGFDSGNKSLRNTFLAMADWAQAHADIKSQQKLTAVIWTDKWNAAQYEKQCAALEYLDIHIVVILCMGGVPVQLPYVYSDRATLEFTKSHMLNDEQTEAIRHIVRIIRSGHPVHELWNLEGIDNDVVYWMFLNAFGHGCNEVLNDLNNILVDTE